MGQDWTKPPKINVCGPLVVYFWVNIFSVLSPLNAQKDVYFLAFFLLYYEEKWRKTLKNAYLTVSIFKVFRGSLPRTPRKARASPSQWSLRDQRCPDFHFPKVGIYAVQIMKKKGGGGWPPSQKQCSIQASRRAFNYAQGKTDTETNFVVTVSFTTKVDHQTTSKLSDDWPWSWNQW